MSKIAIIPARGGSKRIPRKNVRNFLGKPIINYPIQCAIESGMFDRIVVSTDDVEIAEISVAAGAEVPFYRSKDTSNDYAVLSDVLLEVSTQLELIGETYNEICCILATNPLLQINHIKSAWNKFNSGGYDSVFPIVQYGYPIFRSLKVEGEKVLMNWPEYLSARSQDLPQAYHDTGTFYWISKTALHNQKRLFCLNSSYIILTEDQVQDIDTDVDWHLAELKYQKIYANKYK